MTTNFEKRTVPLFCVGFFGVAFGAAALATPPEKERPDIFGRTESSMRLVMIPADEVRRVSGGVAYTNRVMPECATREQGAFAVPESVELAWEDGSLVGIVISPDCKSNALVIVDRRAN